MRLRRLRIHQLRNLSEVELGQLSGLTVVCGANGSGKTSILEAVHLLGTGRPFRRLRFQPLIQYGTGGSYVLAELEGVGGGRGAVLSMEKSVTGAGRTCLNSKQVAAASELADVLPVQAINSDVFGLLDGASVVRREFMDWGTFHVKPSFRESWKRARRCVRQRNILLRATSCDAKSLGLWSERLAACAADIDEMRRGWFANFVPVFELVLDRLSPDDDFARLDLSYYRGWAEDTNYLDCLMSDWERERALGYTRLGPHRADLRVRVEGYDASDVLSRGQKKIVAAALRIAQAEYFRLEVGRSCVLLVDDLAAELDRSARARFCEMLQNTDHQVLLSCIELDYLPLPRAGGDKIGVFHVKHGKIERPV